MFGSKKDKSGGDEALLQSFADAKEATRRATFLYTGATHPAAGKDLAAPYKAAFDRCRAETLALGERLGVSAAEIDAELAAMCDADADRLAKGALEDAEAYARESGAIVQRFLATVKVGPPN